MTTIKPPALLPLITGSGVHPSTGTPAQRGMFRSLAIAASGMSAERLRMEVTAMNVANAETTRTAEGGPYRRKVVGLVSGVGESSSVAAVASVLAAGETAGLGAPAGVASGLIGATTTPLTGFDQATTTTDALSRSNSGNIAELAGVAVTGVEEDRSEGPLVYDPGHPDADQSGYVRMPNVRLTDELMTLMAARRVYEANATVFQSAKSMLRRAIDI